MRPCTSAKAEGIGSTTADIGQHMLVAIAWFNAVKQGTWCANLDGEVRERCRAQQHSVTEAVTVWMTYTLFSQIASFR